MARVTASYGSYQTFEGTGYLSGKIADHLFASVTGDYLDQNDGWGRNVYDNSRAFFGKLISARGKLRWAPDEATDVTVAVLHTYTRNPNGQGAALLPGEISVAGTPSPGFFNVNNNVDVFNLSKDDNQSLTISHDFGPVRLVSISSHDEAHIHASQDTDVSPAPVANLIFVDSPDVTYTQEFQLQNAPHSAISWVVGAFYYNNDLAVDTLVLAPRTYVVHDKTKSYAGFGQVTVPILGTSHATVGLRYTVDDRSQSGSINAVGFAPLYVTNRKLTYRFALDRQFTPTVLGYASYSRGFKSGLFNLTAPTAPAVDPQSVDTYEVGVKSDLFDHHLRFNIAGFYNDFQNIQVRTVANGLSVYLNAGTANVKGFEFDVEAKPVSHVTLQGGFAYLDGHYTSFPLAPFYAQRPTGGATATFGDASGNKTINTPPVALTAGITYDLPTTVGDVVLNATYVYNSGFYWDPQNIIRQPSYSLVNAQVGWSARRGGLSAQLWVRNLTDSHYYATVYSAAIGNQYLPAPPRTYGTTIGWKFS